MTTGQHSVVRPSDGRRRSPIVEAIAFSHSVAVTPARRRLMTIPAYLVAWIVMAALSPVWILVGLVVGVFRRRSFVVLRMLGFLWAYLTIELIGLLFAGAIYVTTPRNAKKREDRFFALECWWGTSLFKAISVALSLSVEVAGDDAVLPGPLLVFIRHASIIDTALPLVFVSNAKGLRLRYVFKRELLMDPCIDVAGHASPNYFIDRTGDPKEELEGVRRLTENLGDEGVLLYPEGTRFTKLKQERALRTLGRHHPELVPIAESMKHCLPPKPGGALTLLEAGEGIDLLLIVHRGLEGMAEVSDLLSGDAVGKKIEIKMRRIPADEIPGPEQRLQWLFDLWKRVDDFVASGDFDG